MEEQGEGTVGNVIGRHQEENTRQGSTCFRQEVLVILGVTLSCAILGAGIGIGFAVGNKNSSFSAGQSNSLNYSDDTEGQLATGPAPPPSNLSRPPPGAPTTATIATPTLPTKPLSQSDTPSVTPNAVSTSTPPTHLPTFGLSMSHPSVIPTDHTLHPTTPLSQSDTPSVTPTTFGTSTSKPPTHLPTTGTSTKNPSVIPTAAPTNKDQPNFGAEDPLAGLDPFEVPALVWKNQGSGLSLQVLNALDGSWKNTFDEVVQEWDNGIPDALSLTVSKIPIEPKCRFKIGMVKVCNGNYGDSRWRGFSEVLFKNDVIIASNVRLNDFYLSGTDDAERQYALCHEMGHAWGLPHTDENFFNKDLGNCLDYTNDPSANKSPGAINFERLATVYGTFETSPKDSSGINSRRLRSKSAMEKLDREFVLGNSSNYETRDFVLGGGLELRTYKLPP